MGSGIERLRPDEITSGTRFPLDLLEKYLREFSGYGILLDVGCGRGDYWEKIKSKVNLVIKGLDLNPKVVERINKTDWPFFAYEGNIATGTGLEQYGRFAGMIESHQAVLAQALFPSLVSPREWQRALKIIDVLLQPGGYLLVTDFARADERESYVKLLKEGEVGENQVRDNILRWKWRYQQNRLAFPDLADLSFLVAKPGPSKFLEWGDWKTLRWLSEGGQFERFARHMNTKDWSDFLRGNREYILRERRWTRWFSRGGGWYPGIIEVWQKPDTYRYHPWMSGLNGNSSDLWDERMRRKGSPHRADYWSDFFKKLRQNLGKWDVVIGPLNSLASHLTGFGDMV